MHRRQRGRGGSNIGAPGTGRGAGGSAARQAQDPNLFHAAFVQACDRMSDSLGARGILPAGTAVQLRSAVESLKRRAEAAHQAGRLGDRAMQQLLSEQYQRIGRHAKAAAAQERSFHITAMEEQAENFDEDLEALQISDEIKGKAMMLFGRDTQFLLSQSNAALVWHLKVRGKKYEALMRLLHAFMREKEANDFDSLTAHVHKMDLS